MLLRETVAVYCDNRTERTDTLCGKKAENHENLISRNIICGKRRKRNNKVAKEEKKVESHEFLFA
jgi:translation initiation factor IF-1